MSTQTFVHFVCDTGIYLLAAMNIRLRNRTKHTMMCKALLQKHAYIAKVAIIALLSLIGDRYLCTLES